MHHPVTTLILRYGIIAGLIVGVLMAVSIHLVRNTAAEAYGMAIGYLTMLIALSTIFVAVKRRRDHDLGGVIRFWPAFGLGIGISVVASVLYVLAWELTQATLPGDFMGEMIAKAIAAEKARGVNGPQLAAYVAQMEKLRHDYANPLFRLPITFTEIFPVGVLVSLVSAGLLRSSRFLPARQPGAARVN